MERFTSTSTSIQVLHVGEVHQGQVEEWGNTIVGRYILRAAAGEKNKRNEVTHIKV